MENLCVACGKEIPEGLFVCPECEAKALSNGPCEECMIHLDKDMDE